MTSLLRFMSFRPPWLNGDFFPNPTLRMVRSWTTPRLEFRPAAGSAGGSSSSIDQMSTNDSVSPTHSLALVDSDINNYGEWYMFLNLAGLVTNNDAVDIQWFQVYSTTNGSMRLSFAFLDSGNNTLFGIDNNVTNQSVGLAGDSLRFAVRETISAASGACRHDAASGQSRLRRRILCDRHAAD